MPNTTNPVVPEPQEPNVSSPSQHTSQPPQQAKGTPPSWVVLVAIGTHPPHYMWAQVKGQLTIGCAEGGSEASPDLDLSPFGAEALTVSGRHAVLYAAQGGLHLRDLSSRDGTKLNGLPL